MCRDDNISKNVIQDVFCCRGKQVDLYTIFLLDQLYLASTYKRLALLIVFECESEEKFIYVRSSIKYPVDELFVTLNMRIWRRVAGPIKFSFKFGDDYFSCCRCIYVLFALVACLMLFKKLNNQ